jgi:hypothetical protein
MTRWFRCLGCGKVWADPGCACICLDTSLADYEHWVPVTPTVAQLRLEAISQVYMRLCWVSDRAQDTADWIAKRWLEGGPQ